MWELKRATLVHMMRVEPCSEYLSDLGSERSDGGGAEDTERHECFQVGLDASTAARVTARHCQRPRCLRTGSRIAEYHRWCSC